MLTGFLDRKPIKLIPEIFAYKTKADDTAVGSGSGSTLKMQFQIGNILWQL